MYKKIMKGVVYMTITEVSHYFNIKPDTLRYYEKIGLMGPVKRDEQGKRDYSQQDIKHLEFIRCMRKAGLSIETLVHYIELIKKGNKTLVERRELLLNEKNQLEKQIEDHQTALERLNMKIKKYDELIKQNKK